MRRLALALALGSLVPAIFACSGATRAPSSTASNPGDASSIPPNQGLGSPCDPALPSACAPGGTACSDVVCEESSGTCIELRSDAPCGSDDGGVEIDAPVGSACSSNAECPSGRACAYLVTLGCSAQGTCVVPSPPVSADGGAIAACGCDGEPTSYVTPLATSAPAASFAACADASSDLDAPAE